MKIRRFWGRLVSVFCPPTCASCENVLLSEEKLICRGCQYHLPINDFHLYLENESYRRLSAKVPIESAAAYLSFSRSSLVQTMLHKIKHRRAVDICNYFGYRFGLQLSNSVYFEAIDMIVPLPKAIKKKGRRTYDPNECLARSIGSALRLPVNTSDFVSSLQIVGNMSTTVFQCINWSSFDGKHVLLVNDLLADDDLLVNAIHALVAEKRCRVSVANLAID